MLPHFCVTIKDLGHKHYTKSGYSMLQFNLSKSQMLCRMSEKFHFNYLFPLEIPYSCRKNI